ncbi:hypothetical protein C4E22_04030 [ANME-1 cluster archaeon AG-394-G06]|nr:hypothetical protein [ANME-1 cluster archaeon AG-394-G06]
MKLKPYPKYKVSGIQWIEEIPEGWGVRKLKFSLLDEKNSIKTGPFGSQLKIDEMYGHEIKVYNQKNVIEKDESIGENYVSLDKFKELFAFKTVPGDLLITTRGTIGRTLRLSKNAEVGILHPCLMKINTDNNKVFDRYIEILIEEADLIKVQLQLLSCATTIEVIYQDNLKEVKLVVPPLPDQTTIASILDKKTAKIDALIEKDKKLIELLKEKRTALINHAVTKGLDPNVKLKDSGVDWIGEIPEGWEVKKLKLVSNRIGDGIHTTPNYVDISDSYFINGNNLVNGRIKITRSTRCVDEIELKKHRQPLNERTLLLSINGTIGNLAFYKGEQIILGKSAAYINLKKKIKVKYVYYFFRCNSIKYYFMKEVTGSTIWNLSLDSVKKTPILYPSSSEQIKIVQYLDKATSKIDKTIQKIEKKIKLLEEYKKSLIHHVVTGKIDVRKSEV